MRLVNGLIAVLICALLAAAGCDCNEPPADYTPPTTPEQRAVCSAIAGFKLAAGYAVQYAAALPQGRLLVDPDWYDALARDWPDVEPFALFSKPRARQKRPVAEYRSALLRADSGEAAALLGCPPGMWTVAGEAGGRVLLLNSFGSDPRRWLGQPAGIRAPKRDRLPVRTGRLLFADGRGMARLKRLSSVLGRIDVTLYRIGRLEVTNAQYAAFLNKLKDPALVEQYYDLRHASAKIVRQQGRWLPLAGCEDLPVTAVSWSGADAFCAEAGGRLPSDLEWEIAARGRRGLLYPWGDDFDPARANIEGREDGYAWLAPVQALPDGRGPFGALHQAGNVFEWIDRPDRERPGSGEPSADLRGGAWDTLAESARADLPDNNRISAANERNGLRCCWPERTPWGDRPLLIGPPEQFFAPLREFPPDVLRRMGAGMPLLRRAREFVRMWAIVLHTGPALIDPAWYPEAAARMPRARPFALFVQRVIKLDRPVIEYRSAMLPDSSAEGAALLGCPAGMWSVALSSDGRSLLVNNFQQDPRRWLGAPGGLSVPAEQRLRIPAGEYLLGNGPNKPGRRVKLAEFFIGKYEVTNAQLAAVLNSLPRRDVAELADLNHGAIKVVLHGGRFLPLAGCERMPATCITWYGAKRICEALGGRLPSGDEWEAAARGNDGRLYPWGNQWNEARTNVWGAQDGSPWLAPVDSFAKGAGPFGALNQSGNAYEWVDNTGRQRNPDDPSDMGELRGGSWMTMAETARLDLVDGNYLWIANDHNGVRCAWDRR